jgi:hypothetical protein
LKATRALRTSDRSARPRRSDAGQARLTERDITGMLLVTAGWRGAAGAGGAGLDSQAGD